MEWHETLDKNSQHFVIGYFDRAKGVLEVKFADFLIYHLNVPLHRLRYITFKDEVIWNRKHVNKFKELVTRLEKSEVKVEEK